MLERQSWPDSGNNNSLSDGPQVHSNGVFQPEVEGITEQCMPDRYLKQSGQLPHQVRQIMQRQVMPCVESNLPRKGHFGSLNIRFQCQPEVMGVQPRVGLGIELDPVRAGLNGGLHHFGVGIQK